MKTAAQAALNYKNNGGSANTANLWASNLVPALPKAFANAAKQVSYWQSQVGSPQAATNYVDGLNTAAQNTAPIAAKINGPAKTTYSTQVSAAGSPGGNYSNFSAEFLPAVSAEIQTLNATNPRGTKADNRARLNAYLDWLDTQAGKFKQ